MSSDQRRFSRLREPLAVAEFHDERANLHWLEARDHRVTTFSAQTAGLVIDGHLVRLGLPLESLHILLPLVSTERRLMNRLDGEAGEQILKG